MKPAAAGRPAGHDWVFQNLSERNMTLDDVFGRIAAFMRQRPQAVYRLIIGTDCQVHAHLTTFVTGIVIQRVGNGAWACYRKVTLPYRFSSIGQKLSYETSLSEQIAVAFRERYLKQLEDIVLPYVYQGASFEVVIDIDAGCDEHIHKTAPFVMDMVQRVEALGMTARVKPDAVVASGYANRFTKHPGQPAAVSSF
ncbi:MAG: hypothetical protein BLM47_10170 [Candidatus Reconcilbacillus cellulovorans]|uniref:Uncharacterized protein n=1 Tax=Candidatus Reconcilbacillus cellulovorans TaxID=1906605 RepID=A0A2A6DZ80_9BACL|nr:MAG: hypothetical protein BLM47_10170 [Candidatus Reconcilbacillus cellulovorans]